MIGGHGQKGTPGAGATFCVRKLLPFLSIVRNCCSHYFRPWGTSLVNPFRIRALFDYLYGTKLALFITESAPDCWPQPFRTADYRELQSTMVNRNHSIIGLGKAFILVIIALVSSGKPAHAQAFLDGTYNCVTVEIDGKTHHCKAPSLEMNSDGSYQILAERGTYEILKGHWLVLSAAKNHGKARLEGSKQIIFEFVSGGKKSKIVYRRKYQRPPAWVSS